MKVYILGNLDGINMVMAACRSKVEFSHLIHASMYQLRKYGCREVKQETSETILVRFNPGVPFFKPINGLSHYGWRKERWKRKELS